MPTRRRLAAWVYTGPIGHLYGGVADWATLLSRYALSRARERARGSQGTRDQTISS
jgi:hypothetical protein